MFRRRHVTSTFCRISRIFLPFSEHRSDIYNISEPSVRTVRLPREWARSAAAPAYEYHFFKLFFSLMLSYDKSIVGYCHFFVSCHVFVGTVWGFLRFMTSKKKKNVEHSPRLAPPSSWRLWF